MHKIAVIGDKDSVMFFKAYGLSTYFADLESPEESRKVLDKWARDDYAVIFVTENVAVTIETTIDRYNQEVIPAIILIPSTTGGTGLARARIRNNVEKAVGINILD